MKQGREPQRVVALLGRRDEPTDGVRDYCRWLAQALERHGVNLVEAEVPWEGRGWPGALADLWKRSVAWSNEWVLLQYTPLGWSRRGFPVGMLATLWLLRLRGARTAVVFHSAEPQAGNRAIDHLRGACQRWIMRRASRQVAQVVLPLPVERADWLGKVRGKATFIPIGSNIPGAADSREAAEPATDERSHQRSATTVVFGVTGGPHTEREVDDICYAARRAKQCLPRLRLVILGRGSTEAKPLLERALTGSGIEIEVLGILPAEEVARALAKADALLFVRGEVAANRGSAIAAIACGLPIVGYGAPDTSFPVSRAGARLVPRGDRGALAEALAVVLSDASVQRELRERSRQALAEHFSWERIAERYLEALDRG